MKQVNDAVTQLNQATQQNASASEELAATAEEMSGQAEQLQQLMGFFKLEGTAGTGIGMARDHAASNPKAAGPGKGGVKPAKVATGPVAGPYEAGFQRF